MGEGRLPSPPLGSRLSPTLEYLRTHADDPFGQQTALSSNLQGEKYRNVSHPFNGYIIPHSGAYLWPFTGLYEARTPPPLLICLKVVEKIIPLLLCRLITQDVHQREALICCTRLGDRLWSVRRKHTAPVSFNWSYGSMRSYESPKCRYNTKPGDDVLLSPS